MLNVIKVIIFTFACVCILFGGALYYHSHVVYPVDCSGIKDKIFKNDCDQVNNTLNNITIGSIGMGTILISIAFGLIINEFLNPKQPLQNEVKQE